MNRITARDHPRFPADARLKLGMLLALLVGVACTAALVGAIVWVALKSSWTWAFIAFCFLLIGLVEVSRHSRPAADASEERRRVERHLDRLCLESGWPPPAVALEDDHVAQLWTTAVMRRRATVHVTVGFVRAATDDELAAALAHELSHIAHGDAVVMTVIGGPPTWILAGLRGTETKSWRELAVLLFFGLPLALVSLPALLAATLLSRQRELAADRGAAILTGSPAQVAATLVRFSDELGRRRGRDLRAIGASNLFYFLPEGREPRGTARLWASHPRLAVRVSRLEAMERRLQTG